MKELDLSLSILNDIIDNDVPFGEALKKVFKADVEKRPYRSTVAAIVGCELRHHILFEYVLNDVGLSLEENRFTAVVLGNIAFAKKIDNETSKKELEDKLGEKYDLVKGFVETAESGKSFIPDDMSRTSNRYLSLRYNTPEWVLKIWQHYGFGVTYKILRKNVTIDYATLRVRAPLTVEEMIKRDSDFVPTPIDGIITYKGKTPIRKIPEYQRGELFKEKPGVKAVVDRFYIEEPKELMAYEGSEDSSLLYELLETYKDSIGMNLVVRDMDAHMLVGKQIRKQSLKNVNLFAAESDSMTSGISRLQDLVFVSPKSTDFDKIREEPDYLLHFHKQDGESKLYSEEKEILENCSKFVAESGTLIYMIKTISKKEGHNLINAFLANHQEFHLVEEKQMFPFEATDTALYYAAMMKQTLNAKESVPLSPLLTEMPTISVCSNAEPRK